VHICF